MSRIRMFSSVLVLVLAAWATAQTATEEGVKIRWDFESGQEYKVEMQQEMSQEMEIHGQTVKTSNDSNTYMTWKVNEVDGDGSAKIETTIDRMTMEMEVPMMGAIKFDSDSEEEVEGQAKQFTDMFKPMIGKTMKQMMNANGKVTEVEIPDGMFAGMQANPMMGQMMNPKQMKDMITKASPSFPEDGLTPGKSWDQETETKTPVGVMTMNSKFTYKGAKKLDDALVHQIDVASTMDFNTEDSPMGVKVEVAEQLIEGSLFFDAENGMMHSTEMEQTMVMNLEGQGQTMTQKMKQVMKGTFRRK